MVVEKTVTCFHHRIRRSETVVLQQRQTTDEDRAYDEVHQPYCGRLHIT